MFVRKAEAYPSGATKSSSPLWYALGLTNKHYAWLESLLALSRKIFYDTVLYYRPKSRGEYLKGASLRVGSSFALKHQTRLERFARDKHPSLSQKFLNYVSKKFNIGPYSFETFWNYENIDKSILPVMAKIM